MENKKRRRIMKKIIVGVLIGFLFVFVRCNDDDGYPISNMWIGFGVFHTDNNSSKIIMDNKDILVPIASNYTSGWKERIKQGARILVNYTILEEEKDTEGHVKKYFVKVNSYQNILMKGVMDITPENKDSIGNDAIIVSGYWLTDSLLNFKLKYWGHSSIHFLNLVKDTTEITANKQPIKLQLRHNANDDEPAFLYTAYISFSLNSLRIAGQDSVKFAVTATDYDGNKFSKEGVFNYTNLSDIE
jgi:hypothetical protein